MDDNNSEAKRPAPGDRADDAPPTRRRRTRPIWRKGWFWVGVIVAEVAVVLVLSSVFERSATEVDLAGADTTAFCALARSLREDNLRATEQAAAGDSVGDPTAFENERDAYVALAAVAPPALVPDLERLAEIDAEIVVVVGQIAEAKAADPSYSGLEPLAAELERASAKGRVAAARVNLVLREQCAIEPAADPAGGTVPADAGGPGTSRP